MLALILFSILFASALSIAADKDIVKIKGVIMSIDLKKSTIVVNEKRFMVNENTILQNETGVPITLDKLKKKNWVYLEGVHDKSSNRRVAQKIYFLSKGTTDGKETFFSAVGK